MIQSFGNSLLPATFTCQQQNPHPKPSYTAVLTLASLLRQHNNYTSRSLLIQEGIDL